MKNSFKSRRNNFRRKLITLVKQNPLLWNKSKENYNKKTEKSEAWAEISQKLFESEDNIRRTWENLRDQYRRDLKREITYGYQSKWCLYNDMQFIREMVNCKEMQCKYKPGKSDLDWRSKKKTVDRSCKNPEQFTDINMPVDHEMLQPIECNSQSDLYENTELTSTNADDSATNDQSEQADFSPLQKEEIIYTSEQQLDIQENSINSPENSSIKLEYMVSADTSEINDAASFIAVPATDSQVLSNNLPQISLAYSVASTRASRRSRNYSFPQPIQSVKSDSQNSKTLASSDNLSSNSTQEIQDDEFYFVLSLLPSLRRVPINRKLSLRIGIMNLIAQNIEDGNT